MHTAASHPIPSHPMKKGCQGTDGVKGRASFGHAYMAISSKTIEILPYYCTVERGIPPGSNSKDISAADGSHCSILLPPAWEHRHTRRKGCCHPFGARELALTLFHPSNLLLPPCPTAPASLPWCHVAMPANPAAWTFQRVPSVSADPTC